MAERSTLHLEIRHDTPVCLGVKTLTFNGQTFPVHALTLKMQTGELIKVEVEADLSANELDIDLKNLVQECITLQEYQKQAQEEL